MQYNWTEHDFHTLAHATDTFHRICRSYGYSRILPPNLQPAETMDWSTLQNAVKYTGPDGSLYALKSDPTLSVTAYANQRANAGVAAQKYAYTTSVFKWRGDNNASTECVQLGIEYYGNQGLDSDAETIGLASQYLDAIGIREHTIDLGDTQYLGDLLDRSGLSPKDQQTILSLIRRKNIPALEEALGNMNLMPKIRDALLAIPELFGPPIETLGKARTLALSQEMHAAVQRVERMFWILKDYEISDRLIVDFSFVNRCSYYSSSLFRIYADKSGRLLGQGGRYDHAFQSSLYACGLSMNLNTINEVIQMKNTRTAPLKTIDFAILYKESNRKDALQLSTQLREMGFAVTTRPMGASLKENIQSPEFDQVNRLVEYSPDRLKVVDLIGNAVENATVKQFLRKVSNQTLVTGVH